MPSTTVQASVIIPTFNRAATLLKTLRALASNTLPPHLWEIIVVDDGSTDETASAIADWIAGGAGNVRYLRQPNKGPAAARNRGASSSRGKLLIFIDNDILVQPNFIRAHVEAQQANPGAWVIGRIVHPQEILTTPFGRYRNALWDSFHHLHPAGSAIPTAGITAANLSLPAEDFNRLGGFDEDFTIASSEDWDLGQRARQAGIRVLYCPEITVLHDDWATSLPQFCRRQYLYSVSDVWLWHKYGAASPRARMVNENAPVNWSADPLRLVAKKTAKKLLAAWPGQAMVGLACRLAERLVPDSPLNHRLYNVAVSLAIFRGVRDGLKTYGAAPVPARSLA